MAPRQGPQLLVNDGQQPLGPEIDALRASICDLAVAVRGEEHWRYELAGAEAPADWQRPDAEGELPARVAFVFDWDATRAIELTRFPVPQDNDHAETDTEAGLVRKQMALHLRQEWAPAHRATVEPRPGYHLERHAPRSSRPRSAPRRSERASPPGVRRTRA